MTETTTRYPAARSLQLGINRVEDRVVLICHTLRHGRRAAWLTRRLLRTLLDRYAGFLADSSPTAAQVGPAHRADVLQMEHISALAADSTGEEEAETGERGDADAPPGHFLVTEAHFQAREGAIVLALDGVARPGDGANRTGREAVFALSLARTDAHKLLDMLKRKGEEAGWDLPAPSPWTEAPRPAGRGAVN